MAGQEVLRLMAQVTPESVRDSCRRARLRGLAAVLALTALTSCSAADVRQPVPQKSNVAASATAPPTTSAAGTTSGTGTAGSSACAREAQPRRLLTTDDVWSMADLDAMSQIAYQLGASCDQGPPWPQECDSLWRELHDEWPGYRTEGAYYTAAISLLHVSGKSVSEELMLFGTPGSAGLTLAVDQATKCGATASSAVGDARVYRYPATKSLQRALIVDQLAVIHLEAPADVNFDKLIKTALLRMRAT